VVRAALGVLDKVGFDEFSMRALALALGVQNPALYWHFRDKQELLDRMAQTLLDDAFAALEVDGEPTTWDEHLLRLARGSRQAMRTTRDGARLLASAELSYGDALLGRMDRAVGALVSAGFPGPEALWGVLTIIHYTFGATFEEQADPRLGGPKLTKARLRGLPALAAVFAEMGEAPTSPAENVRFERGIGLILDGLRARRPPPRRRKGE
jgi:TetR/AcrR family tetracycline transcriptional repressor